MECLLICLGTYFIQHMGSFNYGKIRTMGAVLVAISIPIFTTQLEKARESTDAANLRAAYATASVKVLESEKGVAAGPVAMTQTTAGFASDIKNSKIGNVELSSLADAAKSVSYYVNVSANGTVTIKTSVESGFTTVDPTTGASATTNP